MVSAGNTKWSPPKNVPPRIVPWQGDLPEGLAHWIDRQTEWDRIHSFGVVCKFRPIRELINIARDLNRLLENGPRGAASGYWSFEKYLTTMREVEKLIGQLHRRVNEGAGEMKIFRRHRFNFS